MSSNTRPGAITSATKLGHGERFFVLTVYYLFFPYLLLCVAAFSGWLLGMTALGDWVVAGAGQLGLHLQRSTLWEVTAFLAWVSMYFKSMPNNSLTVTSTR